MLGDAAVVTATLDRLLDHGHVLKCGPRSRRTKAATAAVAEETWAVAGVKCLRVPPCSPNLSPFAARRVRPVKQGWDRARTRQR
jgi:hypothetical protein